MVYVNTAPLPTCPICADVLETRDDAHRGEFFWCPRDEARYFPEDMVETDEGDDEPGADAEPGELTWSDYAGAYAVVVGGQVYETFTTAGEAGECAGWLVSQGGALLATVQAYDPSGAYLPDDHGC